MFIRHGSLEITLIWRILLIKLFNSPCFQYHKKPVLSFIVVDLFTETSSFSDHLQEAQVLALSQDACIDYYSHTGYEIYDDMMCAGHNNDDYTGACYVSPSK